MDGHSSHVFPEMIRTAADEGIVLFTLPPHTTHLLQPLNKGPFSPLKAEWRKSVHRFITSNPGRTGSRYDFSSLFSESWYAAMSAKNVAAGFRFCGVYPLNKNAVFAKKEDELIKPANRIKSILSPLRSDFKFPCCTSTPKSYFLTPERRTYKNDSKQQMALERSFSDDDIRVSSDSQCFLPLKRARSLSRFLITPVILCKQQNKTSKSSGRVLTSEENMEIMEEKLRLKREKVAEKEARAKARENKRLAKSKAKQLKSKKKIPGTQRCQ